MSNYIKIILENLDDDLVKIIYSNSNSKIKKVIVRVIELKSQRMFQIEKYIDKQVFHENVSLLRLKELIQNDFEHFKQILIKKTQKDISIFKFDDDKTKIKTVEHKLINAELKHNKEKKYILQEGTNIQPLIDLGVFSKDMHIVKSMYNKYRQINRFIEIINDEMKNFDKEEITILDFGCGKSYLTFIVYYYFKELRGLKVKVKGYDLKEDVVNACNGLAKKYQYEDLEFIVGDVSKENIDFEVDVVLSLHACDTATDYALYNAIINNVKYIFSVPCCQHEINKQIKTKDELNILLQHGLIKERFSSLLTDALRCEILKEQGYKVDVIEFVDLENSPKNLMIRAIKAHDKKNVSQIKPLLDRFNSTQTLYELIYKK